MEKTGSHLLFVSLGSQKCPCDQETFWLCGLSTKAGLVYWCQVKKEQFELQNDPKINDYASLMKDSQILNAT